MLMKTITFDDYITAVKLKFEVEKMGTYAGFLSNPSPAELRNFSLLIFKNGLSHTDEQAFRFFFDVKPDGDLKKGIEYFDVERFRSVKNFLVGKNQKTSHKSVELIAVLVDFQPRPFQKFIKNVTENEKGDCNIQIDNPLVKEKEVFLIDTDEITTVSKMDENGSREKQWWKKPIAIAASLMLFVSAGFTVKTIYFPTKNCMTWKTDHYEAICCDEQPLGFVHGVSTIPRDDKTLQHMRKIKADKNTKFFVNEKVAIWYKKKGDDLECFTAPGLHPETGETLKPITRHMIEKYVFREN